MRKIVADVEIEGSLKINGASVDGYGIGESIGEDLLVHTENSSIHFTQSSISITESQISNLQNYALNSHIHTNYEPILGNPTQDGYVLSSTISGSRSWIQISSGSLVASDISVENTDGYWDFIEDGYNVQNIVEAMQYELDLTQGTLGSAINGDGTAAGFLGNLVGEEVTFTDAIEALDEGYSSLQAGLASVQYELDLTQGALGLAINGDGTIVGFTGNLVGAEVTFTDAIEALDEGYSSLQTDLASHIHTNYEPTLGNPTQDGYVLSSTTSGSRSWIQISNGLIASGISVENTDGYWDFIEDGYNVQNIVEAMQYELDSIQGTLGLAINGDGTAAGFLGNLVGEENIITFTDAIEVLDEGYSSLQANLASVQYELDLTQGTLGLAINGNGTAVGFTGSLVGAEVTFTDAIEALDEGYSSLQTDLGSHVHTNYEPILGNPTQDGYILSSTTSGSRSWIQPSTASPILNSLEISTYTFITNSTYETILDLTGYPEGVYQVAIKLLGSPDVGEVHIIGKSSSISLWNSFSGLGGSPINTTTSGAELIALASTPGEQISIGVTRIG